jgi:hypothetical protein
MRGSDGIVLLRFAQPNHRYPLVSAGQLSAARDQSTQPTLPLDQRPTRERSSSSTANMSFRSDRARMARGLASRELSC